MSVELADMEFAIREISRWDELIGNEKVRDKALKMLHHRGVPPRMFVAGPSGSGKSTTINHVCRSAACYAPRGDDPCGVCNGCRKFLPSYSNTGLFAYNDHLEHPRRFHSLRKPLRRRALGRGVGQNRPAAHQFLASVDLLFEHVVPRACGILVLRHVPPPPCACTLRAHLCSRWAESACAGAIRYRHCSRRKRLRSLRFVLFSLVHGKDHPKANLTRCVGRRAVVASAASGHVDRYAAPPAAALEHLRYPSG